MHFFLCLPTEPTLATVAAVVAFLEKSDATVWQLSTNYQTVKGAWKAMATRFGKVGTLQTQEHLEQLPGASAEDGARCSSEETSCYRLFLCSCTMMVWRRF